MTHSDDVQEATHNHCDKCGRPVPSANDRRYLDVAMTGDLMILSMQYARHLLPAYDNEGNQVCEGSPSRAQYLAGQPRDTRGYSYEERLEPIIRQAYAAMQRRLRPES